MRDSLRRLWRRIEDFFFVLSLTRVQAWRQRSSKAFRKQEEERRSREIMESTRDYSASF